MSQNESNKTAWYQKPVGIISMLILFFPVGLFLMWKYTNWNPIAKWVITGIFAILVLLVGSENSTPSQTVANTNNSVAETPANEVPVAEPNTAVIFDLPALYGKNTKEIREVLGVSTKDIDGYLTYEKEGYTLLISYDANSQKVKSFFVSPDEKEGESQYTDDIETLKEVANVKTTDLYSVQQIESLEEPGSYTGISVIQK